MTSRGYELGLVLPPRHHPLDTQAIDCHLIVWSMTESLQRCVNEVETPFGDMFLGDISVGWVMRDSGDVPFWQMKMLESICTTTIHDT